MHNITISDRAKEEIFKIVKEKKLPATAGFRFGVKGGGCSGFMYHCQITDKEDKNDEVFEFPFTKKQLPSINNTETIKPTVRVFVDKKSIIFASGTHIDYKRALMGAGFQFVNPNSAGSCGCGESFSV